MSSNSNHGARQAAEKREAQMLRDLFKAVFPDLKVFNGATKVLACEPRS